MKEYRNVILALLLLLVALGVPYYLFVSERERQREVETVESRPVLDLEATVWEAQSSGETEVTLFFYRPGAFNPYEGFLVSEVRPIYETGDDVLTARQIVNEVIRGPRENGARVLHEETRLRQVFLSGDGTAIVDLSAEATAGLAGGITSELAAIYAVTRSLTTNLESIKAVKFLIEGREASTFSGHVSIQEPFL